jgi:hypothetical protein
VVADVNRVYGTSITHEQVQNSRTAGRVVFALYSKAYKSRTQEQIARRWNGGPTGDKKTATVKYWKKVKKEIDLRSCVK